MGNRQGRYRPGFEVVRRAVLACVPGADGVWYDSDSEEIALSISGNPQPFGNLSAGQRVMLVGPEANKVGNSTDLLCWKGQSVPALEVVPCVVEDRPL